MKAKMFAASIVGLAILSLPQLTEAGSFGKGDPHGPVGEWYIGENPTIPNQQPPVLFVHGYNSSSLTWWNDNDMYDLFRESGYRTSFINLHPDRDMYANGAILNDKLKEIYDYFGEKVMVVAHSKGGLDTQTALTHYDAEPYVSKVVTLSSPHYGSELADLAHSNWASWLTGIIGARSEATESLQTGEMAHFRSVTDPLAEQLDVPFYTLSGNEPGSFGSALYWGGLYLRSYGINDGSVTVSSSRLNYAEERESGPWNHSEVKTGEFTYSFIEPLMTSQSAYEEQTNHTFSDYGSIVRGGETVDKVKEEFLLEDEVESVAVHLLADEKLTDLSLQAPDGSEYETIQVRQEEEHSIFEDAWAHSFEVEQPVNGDWTLSSTLEEDQSASYLMIVGIEGGLSSEIQLLPSTVSMQLDEQQISQQDTTYTLHVDDELVVEDEAYSSFHSATHRRMNMEGSQTMTFDVKGQTKDGEAFERTFIKNIHSSQ